MVNEHEVNDGKDDNKEALLTQQPLDIAVSKKHNAQEGQLINEDDNKGNESKTASLEKEPEIEKAVELDGEINESKQKPLSQELLERFIIHPKGKNSVFIWKNSNQEAFTDKGNKMVTKSNSETVAKSIVDLADSKGWESLKASGSNEFRKSIWLEASLRGMDVKGYTPNETDLAQLKALKEKQAINDSKINSVERLEPTKVEPASGTASVGESKKEEGEPAKEQEKDEKDTLQAELLRTFTNDKPEVAIAAHPKLKELYTLVMTAEAAAQRKYPEDNDKVKRFVTRVRDRGIREIATGNKLPAVTKALQQHAVQQQAIIKKQNQQEVTQEASR